MIPKKPEAIVFGFAIGIIIFGLLVTAKGLIVLLVWMLALALFSAIVGGIAAGVEYFHNPPKRKKEPK